MGMIRVISTSLANFWDALQTFVGLTSDDTTYTMQCMNSSSQVLFAVRSDGKVTTISGNELDDGGGNAKVTGTLLTTVIEPATGSIVTIDANLVTSTLRPGSFTVATLPAGTNGMIVFASDACNTGEITGSGTGCVVQYNQTIGSWCYIGTTTPVSS
jgi:hypothetical protein